jgi:hypothetical protein
LADSQYRDVVKQQNQTFPLFDLTKLWLSKLPLRLDGMEAKTSLKHMLDLIERKDEVFFPNGVTELTGSPFLLDILRVFGESVLSFFTYQDAMQAANATIGGLDDDDDDENDVILAHPLSINRIRQIVMNVQVATNTPIGTFANQLPGHLKDALVRVVQ